MSLYDGLGIDDKGVKAEPKPDVAAGWSSGFKLLQSQLHARKASVAQQPSSKRRSGGSLPPVVDLKRGRDEEAPLQFNAVTGKLVRGSGVPIPASPFIGTEAPGNTSLTGVPDEYDPFRPNEYEDYCKKRKEQRQKEKEEERRKEMEERERSPVSRFDSRSPVSRFDSRSSASRFDSSPSPVSRFDSSPPLVSRFDSRRRRERQDRGEYSDEEEDRRPRRHQESDSEEEEEDKTPRRVGGAAIAPPSSLLEDEPKIPAPELSKWEREGENSPPRPGLGTGGAMGQKFGGFANSVASKIMARYGYREGQGLGKMQQGMSTALQVEKTSKRGGKIIHEKDIPKVPEPPRAETGTTNANLLKNPSKVILLRNMVGPGEVDEDLEPETAEECSKYGKVIKCLIFEIPGAIEEEAVRIFLEFERMESAIKAVVDLNGRFFGGRVVKACFYNLDKFRRLDLADET